MAAPSGENGDHGEDDGDYYYHYYGDDGDGVSLKRHLVEVLSEVFADELHVWHICLEDPDHDKRECLARAVIHGLARKEVIAAVAMYSVGLGLTLSLMEFAIGAALHSKIVQDKVKIYAELIQRVLARK